LSTDKLANFLFHMKTHKDAIDLQGMKKKTVLMDLLLRVELIHSLNF